MAIRKIENLINLKMKRINLLIGICVMILCLACSQESSESFRNENGDIKVLIIKDPYSDSRTGPEILKGPEKLDNEEFREILDDLACEIINTTTIKMPEELEYQYGEWNRASLTNNVMNKVISDYDKDELFIIGLLSGSKSIIGMLGGLQHLGPGREPLKDSRNRDIVGLPRLGKNKPLKVGIILISSKAFYNTPDITLEGDMGGMNLAVAAGLCNTSLRLQAGLDPPIPTKHIVMLGVCDTNPYEDHLIDNSFIRRISVEDVKEGKNLINEHLEYLSQLVDVIYVHVDLAVLGYEDPDNQHNYLLAKDLVESIKLIFSYPKTVALGIASCPDNPDEKILKVGNQIIKTALESTKIR